MAGPWEAYGATAATSQGPWNAYAPKDAPASFAERFDAAPPAPQPSLLDAVTDIPKEVKGAYTTAIQHATGNSVSDLPGFDPRTRGELGPIEGLARTGKQVLGIPELLSALPVGVARSVIGHLMAHGEHWVGTLLNPERAANDDPQKMYETAKGDVDTAMSAARPAGAPVRALVPALPAEAATAALPAKAAEPAAVARVWQEPAAPPKVAAPSVADLKAEATKGYESPVLTDLEVKSTTISDFGSRTKMALDAAGLDENLAPKTHAILSKFEKIPGSGPSVIVTGKNIMSMRKTLGNAAGEPGQEGLAASRAINALDEHIPKIEAKDVISGSPKAAGEALETGNANYSAAKQAESIDNKVISAELRAASTNSGANVANTIRQRMAAIVDPTRPKEGRGLLPAEVTAARTIAEGTRGQNALRKAGNVLGGGGGLGMLHASSAGAGAGAFVAGPVGAAIGAALPAIAGHTLKAISNKMTLNQAAKLSEMIRSRSPLASSMDKFEVSAGALAKSRNPKAISGAVIAARNLSNNLRAAGFDVSPGDLLTGLQSPSSAGAQDQK
jgi:hypothetical protein